MRPAWASNDRSLAAAAKWRSQALPQENKKTSNVRRGSPPAPAEDGPEIRVFSA